MAKNQGQVDYSRLGAVIRPIGGIELGLRENTIMDHEICVTFPCGQEIVVNQNVKYSLQCLIRDNTIFVLAVELLTKREGCVLLKIA